MGEEQNRRGTSTESGIPFGHRIGRVITWLFKPIIKPLAWAYSWWKVYTISDRNTFVVMPDHGGAFLLIVLAAHLMVIFNSMVPSFLMGFAVLCVALVVLMVRRGVK